MPSALLPRPQAALVTQDGRPTTEFYNFLLDLDNALGTDYASEIQAIAARLAALEEGQGATLRGIGSVRVRNGVVTLLADEDNPTGSAYYGTDMHGNRGFHPVINAFDTRYGIEKDTPTGYVVLGTLDDPSELPEPPGAPLEAYLIDGNYWVSDGTEWSNAGPPTNIAVLGLMRGIDRNDGLLWNDTIGDYEVAPIVRNPMTTTGDLIYGDPSKTPARLPIGSNKQLLAVASGKPAWSSLAAVATTDDLPEGAANLYYTNGRADARIAAWLATLKDLPDAPDDAAAAALGVPEGGMYRNGSYLMVRISGSDPFIAYVVSIANDFGADGSTDFPDVLAHTWTAFGDAVVDRDNPNFPDGGILFDGSGDYIDGDSSADWTLGTGDFCIEAFVQLTGSGNRAICSFLSNNTWYIDGSGNIYFYDGSINVINGGTFPTGASVHVALTRASGTLRMFINGNQVASATWTGNVSSSNFRWGAATGGSPSSFFSGLIGRRRITKGVPRHTTNFTPPSGPFPTS